MAKYIIHIGLQKTGTTFLQKEIFSNYSNVLYLTRPYTQFNSAFNLLQYADDSLFDMNELLKEFDNHNSKKILISDEGISGKIVGGYNYINRTMIATRLSNVLKRHETELIIFIRGQKSMLESLYNQWVKSHLKGDRPIKDFIWIPKKNTTNPLLIYKNCDETISTNDLYYNTNRDYVHADSFKYYELIKLYKSLFEKVHVFLYEDLKLNPHLVLDKLDEIIQAPRRETQQTHKNLVNSSLPFEKLYAKTVLNKYINLTSKIPYTHRVLKTALLFKKNASKQFRENHNTFLDTAARYYIENNKKLINEFPEIGIQNYPNAYLIE